ncbi:unnamed protein product [Protopolystoma xenopodis]|uniref:Protein kinase domain-containing protein n=1 Tax=Protopolystoma xenopodis TaxID=117903 RepID=A0A448WB75_9PLAT|nr:unnamed protein product [Protopolystoma xenopodis]
MFVTGRTKAQRGIIGVVVNGDPPRLPDGSIYSDDLRQFIARCLIKDDTRRDNYVNLLASPFLRSVDHEMGREVMREFVCKILGPPPKSASLETATPKPPL